MPMGKCDAMHEKSRTLYQNLSEMNTPFIKMAASRINLEKIVYFLHTNINYIQEDITEIHLFTIG